ncbi:MAG: BNR repeat-containing protein [Verrucomicrobiales bacterium]
MSVSAAAQNKAKADCRASSPRYTLVESIDIAPVVSDFRVGFDLLTTSSHQFVAYYDAERRMTVSSRALDSKVWTHQVLPSNVGWDSHNYITMALDPDGHLHVSGNLHCNPLVYFRTRKPGDITTLQAAPMTGELEDKATYPQFLHDAKGRLVFTYRHGSSGNGINIYNLYDTATRTWSRMLDTPLFDGEGLRNAYPSLPTFGPDGWFHTHWVWRDTSDCATNQHLSHARSRDLLHWESIFGQLVKLPIRFDQRELIVDPIPSGGGIINGGHRLAFDSNKRPLLAYHKADKEGNMQIYVARAGKNSWESHVLTDWNTPIPFAGGGTMPFIGIAITRFEQIAPGILGVGYNHKEHGSGLLQIDERTLQRVDKDIKPPPSLPPELKRRTSTFPGMGIQRISETDKTGGGFTYLLQWESLEANHDRRPEPPLPAPSMLRLHKLKRTAGTE